MPAKNSQASPPLEHGKCPHCGVSLDGGGIWQHFYQEFTTIGDWQAADGECPSTRRVLTPFEAEIRADEVAENYGATRTKGRWGRDIAILERDRASMYGCPDCKGMWSADGALLDKKLTGYEND